MVMENPIEMIEKQVFNLPLIDSAVVKIITLLNNPASNFEQIVDRLSPDLSTRFLSIANSAYYGREVSSIHFAVKLLGYSKMRDILITSIIMDHFTRRLKGFDFEKFLKHAQFCSAIAKILGEILEYNRPDDLFTVATLQNIGKLVIAVYYEDQHKEIIALKRAEGLTTREAEKKILGISHGEIGAIVLKRFSVPREICEAVKFHDTAEDLLPDAADYLLSYIAREAGRIVGMFSLPEEKNPLELTGLLSDTIAAGKSDYRDGVREKMRSQGYEEIFPELLKQAVDRVIMDLKQYLPQREPQQNDQISIAARCS
jgi:HD-like signal output (HDOD) protein